MLGTHLQGEEVDLSRRPHATPADHPLYGQETQQEIWGKD